MRILVCGSREFDNYDIFRKVLDKYLEHENITIIHGGARGADSMAGTWARANKFSVEVYPADWGTHGRSAGPIRNAKMLTEGKPELVIAFPTAGSRGTWNMVELAKEAGIETIVVEDPQNASRIQLEGRTEV